MIEKEYWGILSEPEFTQKIQDFTARFGEPRQVKRLSLEVGDWERPEIDNRIKITNGKPEFVQKLGNWNNRERTEIEVELIPEVEGIFALRQALFETLNPKQPSQLVIQHHNFLFDTPEVEIKLSHQTGKSDKYTFEVELKQEADLDQICADLGLTPDHEIKDKAFWTKWNAELNLEASELSPEELKQLIQDYLTK